MNVTSTSTTCPYCGLGCGLIVTVEDGTITTVKGTKGHPVNDGDICALAANLPPVLTAPDRLTQPLLRVNEVLVPTTWDEAIDHVSSGLNNIIKEHGPDSVAFYGGASNLTEEYYVMNKLMKGAIGTNNVECSTRLCMASSAAGFISTLGADAPPMCYADIELADLFFIAGCNMAVSVPILFRRIRAARERSGAKVIVVDPRKSETAAIADIHLQIWPGTDVALNNGLAHVLLEEGFVDDDGVEHHASGLMRLKDLVKEYTPTRVATITGCSETQILETARLIGSAKAMMTLWFQGYNHSTQAVFKNNTLHNLSLLTNNFCRPGAGPLSITGEANALGNRWVGALSHLLPGMRSVTNAGHRQEVAEFWGVEADRIQAAPGRTILEIIEGLHSGEIKALWITTTNPAASLPNTRWVEDGLTKADLLIVQDIYHPTETTALADVVFAGAQWCEKTGTFISSERRIELVEKVVDPPGEARPDYEIICQVAREMGFESQFPFSSSEDVFEEWKGVTEGRLCDMTGVSYERLRNQVGIQLPCPDPDHPGTARLFTDQRFPRPDGRAALLAREYLEPAETQDDEYPFVLITGRISTQFNTRTRTGRVNRLNRLNPGNIIQMNPSDAENKGLTEGALVQVTSRRGVASGVLRVTDTVQVSNIFMSSHYGWTLGVGKGQLANLVTHQSRDAHSAQPELKYTAVRIDAAPGGVPDE